MGAPPDLVQKRRRYRRQLITLIAAPVLVLPLLAIEPSTPSIGRTAWAAAVIAIYWATECLPMAVTSLLPMVLFPLLGVVPADAISRNYFQDKIVLFFGGLIIACGLELVDLHKRIALRVLLLFGAKPPQLLAGFMASTAFVSMWMSNTATAAMMMPIAEAVLGQLERAARDGGGGGSSGGGRAAATARGEARQRLREAPDDASAPGLHWRQPLSPHWTAAELEAEAAAAAGVSSSTTTSSPSSGDTAAAADADAARRFAPLGKAMVLSIAYAANIGGMATLTGTGPNLVLAGDLAALYPLAPGLSFASWIAFGLPLAITLLLVAWGLFCATLLRGAKRLYAPHRVRGALHAQYIALGPMTWRERLVLGDFVALAVLWISRDPKVLPGWGALFSPHHVTDGTIAALMASLLFALPADPPAVLFGGGGSGGLGRVGDCLAPAQRSAAAATRGGGGGGVGGGGGRARVGARVPPEVLPGGLSLSVLATAVDVGAVAVDEAGDEAAGGGGGGGDGASGRAVAAAADDDAEASTAPSLAEDAAATAAAAAAPVPVPAAASHADAAAPAAPAAAAAAAAADGYAPLLEWRKVQPLLPWHVILLLGGGFALADACVLSGLSARVGASLAMLNGLPPALVSLLLMCIVSATTAVTSNVATASIFLPVVSGLAQSMRVHPLSYMIPAALTCSLAFVLPVSTPPNAMAYASGRLEVKDMVGLGLAMNALGVLAILIAMHTLAPPLFGVGGSDVPDVWRYHDGANVTSRR